MHRPTAEEKNLASEVNAWAIDRLTFRDDTFPGREQVAPLPPIEDAGIGATAAWRILRDQVMPTALPADHPRYLAFVGGSPTVMSVVADIAVSAASVYAGSSLEGGVVVDAEGAALRWLAQLAGMPESAFGTFVSGGSTANLSALVAARYDCRRRTGHQPTVLVAGKARTRRSHRPPRSWAAIWSWTATQNGNLDADAITRILRRTHVDDIIAVVATAGATNTGAIDDLESAATLCRQHGLWLHVDAAYGGAALLSERARPLFRGIEAADSVTIDPHKWLFSPFDCAAVIYRDPERARRAHTQVASYLESVSGDHHVNPADYAIHLTRRARGIPLWLSLMANGTAAYRAAVEHCLVLAAYAARRINESARFALGDEPTLSVVLFRRIGWTSAQYHAWSARSIANRLGLMTPTEHRGETMFRLCFVNPVTSTGDIDQILAHID